MEFNINKCKVMHLGANNQKYKYHLNNEQLVITQKERDLGVIINKTLKPAEHIGRRVKMANQVLGMIKRHILYKEKHKMLLLYCMLVNAEINKRPSQEYCVQAWSPHQIGDIKFIEGVQRGFTNMITGIKKLCYQDRLKKLKLTTLETRRIRVLIEVLKL